MELEISDQDIEIVESLLLLEGAHFSEDGRNVIRCWHSTDVVACPGSGKTTILLAKLKLLADRMPLVNGAGICVLSHTNVAVDEIKKRLSDYADRLLSYPNYIGTIQSFVDRFVAIPYLRNSVGRNVQAVDNVTYARYMLNKMQNNDAYSTFENLINSRLKNSKQFKEAVEYIQALCLQDDGALGIESGKQTKVLASAKTLSAKQYRELIEDLLKDDGIMRYQDAYRYAEKAVQEQLGIYTNLFSSRFQYVFIDEYQDCDEAQRRALEAIFDVEKCTVMKIGDVDQAIYNASNDKTPDWVPRDGFLPITTSYRYNQEIADVIFKLRKNKERIVTFAGKTGIKPILLIFEPEGIDRVVNEFVNILDSHGICDKNGIYKVVGAIKSEASSGLKIGSYWPEFDSAVKKQNEYTYWGLVDEIIKNLLEGKLYKAERIIRKLLCRVFHYAKIKHPVSGKDFSVVTIKGVLADGYQDIYRQWIYELSRLENIERKTVECLIRKKINEILKVIDPQINNVFACLPKYFCDDNAVVNQKENSEKNIFIDSTGGRRIEFDTVHGVKGETHDATLYLETSRQNGTDLGRILPYYGVGKVKDSDLFDHSRKLAYVGMSRPRKLLCVAMQAKTYEKSKNTFVDDWEILDLRK